ncbi:L-type lectin-domain containing receptor kinase IV.2-like [Iris pallida]|uniref:L-type lectin-domain containing receptor kinase IV.2-like n=1 Tax=Iris pallida TaxID=29817 RepID=A0AAX6HTB8_IRIPA|nr:L-type lectin-domain containing receptor kinase IV.2-like [Iris pallida]KAJ6832970.1 L-type lectin-domain containing receptor kinase IV.2-like [Iris pallida]KAJ6843953.1 L-type lectin-domain containing receptor kinase IV.2-like [Iris pallida]
MHIVRSSHCSRDRGHGGHSRRERHYVVVEPFVLQQRQYAEVQVRRSQLRERRVPVQELHHLPHARPRRGHWVRAQKPELKHQLHLRNRKLLLQSGVARCEHRALLPVLQHPVHQHHLLRFRLDGPPAAGHLEQERSVGEHVRRGGRLPGPCQLGRDVAHRAHNMSCLRNAAVLVQPSEAEIS